MKKFISILFMVAMTICNFYPLEYALAAKYERSAIASASCVSRPFAESDVSAKTYATASAGCETRPLAVREETKYFSETSAASTGCKTLPLAEDEETKIFSIKSSDTRVENILQPGAPEGSDVQALVISAPDGLSKQLGAPVKTYNIDVDSLGSFACIGQYESGEIILLYYSGDPARLSPANDGSVHLQGESDGARLKYDDNLDAYVVEEWAR